jgi:hypothetical protein
MQQPWWQNNGLMLRAGLVVYGLGFLACSWFSIGTYGGGDSWMHYLFARYAFKHPENFLDQWGKPVFTLLASPWAQLGFGGVKLFNILCALLTGYLSYRIAARHYPRFAWLSIVFVFGVPIYFVCVFSGLTEILFALCLVAGIFLYQEFHERWACLILSFLPFIRSEGFLILPLFGFVTLYYRQYKATLLLASGTLLFSLIGYLVYHNWKWVFSTNPYLIADNVYGKGSLFEFVGANESIAGLSQVILVLASLLLFTRAMYRQIKMKELAQNRMFNIRFVLVFGSFAVYFVAHSIFWKLGIFGSLGLIRVMAGIGPCIGLTAFFAFNELWELKPQWPRWINVLAVLFLISIFLMPLKVNRRNIPYKMSELEQAQYDACNWIKAEKLEDNFFYYFDPFVAHLLDIDKFDSGKSASIQYRNNSMFFKKDAIVIWDANFCPVEGQLPKRWLDENPNFVFLHQEINTRKITGHGDTLEIRIYKTLNDIELKDME